SICPYIMLCSFWLRLRDIYDLFIPRIKLHYMLFKIYSIWSDYFEATFHIYFMLLFSFMSFVFSLFLLWYSFRIEYRVKIRPSKQLKSRQKIADNNPNNADDCIFP